MITVALGLLAFKIAGGKAGAVLGTALAIKMMAYVRVAPVVGGFANRLPRRAFLVSMDLTRAAVAIALPFVDRVWQVYVLIFVLPGHLPRLHAHLPGDHSGRSSGRTRVRLDAFAIAFALALISPGERGFEVRTFECSTCARTEQVSVSIDPMNGDGWAGSLANSGRRAEPASLVRALRPGLLVTPLRPITDDHLADVRLVDAVGLVALAGRARPAHAPEFGIPRLSGYLSHNHPTPLQIGQFGFMPWPAATPRP